jgi:hypothetical protein
MAFHCSREAGGSYFAGNRPVGGAVLGLVLMIAGLLLTLTGIGAIVGIPLMVVGFLLTVKSIF